MQLERKNMCPMLKKKCVGLDCAWFMAIKGQDPTDKDKIIEEWNCAIVWQVTGLLAVAKHTGEGLAGVQAATESFRNEMVNANGIAAVQQQVMAKQIGTQEPKLINK